jgi:hypothetical protein
MSYLDQVADFITRNTQGATLGAQGGQQYVDPYTGESSGVVRGYQVFILSQELHDTKPRLIPYLRRVDPTKTRTQGPHDTLALATHLLPALERIKTHLQEEDATFPVEQLLLQHRHQLLFRVPRRSCPL